MSYKTRKKKRSQIIKLGFVLRAVWVKFFNNVKKTRRRIQAVRLSQTKKVVDFLRAKSRIVRADNLKINEWVEEYIERCFESGELVNILTQWCVSKDLEERFKKQGQNFMPTKKERKLFEIDMPQIVAVFLENGMRLNWWITFNRSYLDSGRIDHVLEDKYKAMIISLADSFSLVDNILFENILFLDWEEEILGGRSLPDARIINDFEVYIPRAAFDLEFQRHSKWAREEAGLNQTKEKLEEDVKFQIVCEAREGEFLTNEKSPFPLGEFILIPLETSERYDFFAVFAKDFKKRIVAVLACYPWRSER